MKLLTKNTDYAVRALIYLARSDDEYVPSREISREDKIPLQYLRRILQELRKEGLVETREGVNGGHRLKVEPEIIKLTRLIEIFQGEIELVECMFRKQICHNRKKCVLRKKMKEIERMVVAELEDVTIGSLVEDMEKQIQKPNDPPATSRNSAGLAVRAGQCRNPKGNRTEFE